MSERLRKSPARATASAIANSARQVGQAVSGLRDQTKPKLLDQVRIALRSRHYSKRTEQTYVHWIKRYIFFHMYGTGMRLMECLRLRVKDIDFGSNQVTIREGKGDKDRLTMLPEKVEPQLREHFERVKRIHARDLADGYGRVQMPHALNRKYPTASSEWGWQFVFPQMNRWN